MTQNEQVRAEVHRPSAIKRTVEQAAGIRCDFDRGQRTRAVSRRAGA